MTIHEFKNLWEVDTPQGYGRAILLESKDNDYYWTVVLADSLAIVTFPQNKIRICRHYSLGLKFTEDDLRVVLK
jgi:hypothetical protein